MFKKPVCWCNALCWWRLYVTWILLKLGSESHTVLVITLFSGAFSTVASIFWTCLFLFLIFLYISPDSISKIINWKSFWCLWKISQGEFDFSRLMLFFFDIHVNLEISYWFWCLILNVTVETNWWCLFLICCCSITRHTWNFYQFQSCSLHLMSLR